VGNVHEILETWIYDPTQGIGELGQECSTHGTSPKIVDAYITLGQPQTSSYTIGNGTGALNYSYSYSYDSVHRPSYYVSPNGTTTPLPPITAPAISRPCPIKAATRSGPR